MPIDRSPPPHSLLDVDPSQHQETKTPNPRDETSGGPSVRKKTYLLTPRGNHVNDSIDWNLCLPQILAYSSLLSQFSNPQVRADFVNGKFGPEFAPELLPQLDELRWILFPRWQPFSLEQPTLFMVEAANCLKKLLMRSTEEVSPSEFGLVDTPSYDKWFKILEAIANSSYWYDVPASNRCTHIIKTDTLINGNSYKLADNQTFKSAVRSDGSSLLGRLSAKGRDKHQRKLRVKPEEIIVSSSQSSPSNNSMKLASSSDESFSASEIMSRSRRSRRRRRDLREVASYPTTF